jgi:hypothetical protein
MSQRKNDIYLSPEELKELAYELESVYRSYNQTHEIFTGSKNLEIYESLRQEILNNNGGAVSTATLRNIMTLTHSGNFTAKIITSIRKYITAFKIALNSPESLGGQKVYWAVNQGLEAGAFIDTINGEFIPWNILKYELETRAIAQCPRIIPPGSKVEKADFFGKKDWVVHIMDNSGKQIGSVWIGGNPTKNWEQDGFIRIGRSISHTQWVVYQILARHADGRYELVKSYV